MGSSRVIVLALACMGWGLAASSGAAAAPVRDSGMLNGATEIQSIVNSKEFYIEFPESAAATKPFRDLEVFLVLRQIEDPLRRGWHDFEFVGRAAVAETTSSNAHFVLYKAFKGKELRKGDRLLRTGDPLTADEMNLMQKEILGVLKRDKELEDYYTGLISLKAGFYLGSLSSTSNSDTNKYKLSNSYLLTTLGVRWWLFFNPSIGFNFDFATSSIPTYNTRGTLEQSSQTYINPGLLYRGRLLMIPTVYSLTYFINRFTTTNTDDFLIGSTYSGPLLGATFYYPYRIQIFRIGSVTFAFNNVEGGIGYSPLVSVSDQGFARGQNSTGSLLQFTAGAEFNLAVRRWHFTNDLFFVFEWGRQMFNLSFSGTTQGTLPSGQPIPENNVNSETQNWYGIRIKFNMKDYLGELISGS